MNTLAAIAAALLLSALPASAGDYYYRQPISPGIAYGAMIGALMENALRPRYVPPPVQVYAPPQGQRPQSRDQWKAAIIEEGRKFCDAYPHDQICHFKDQEVPPQ